MKNNQFALLKDRRFAPLFGAQFLGAFHDNLFKNALAVMLLFGAGASGGDNAQVLVTLAAGVFILPFILFSAMGGQLADKYPKDAVIRIVKLAEIGIAVLGAIALLTHSVFLSFVALFLLGCQSAFFGPSKYSILPQHLKSEELIGGNAMLNTGTFLAILIGTIAGAVMITVAGGEKIVAAVILLAAGFGYWAARRIPYAPVKAPSFELNKNPLTETISILKTAFAQKRGIVQAILGVAWFYFLGGVFLAQMPNYTQETLGANEHVLALFLALFSVGIGVGGLLNEKLLKGRVEAVYVPLAALGITLFGVHLYFAGNALNAGGEELIGLGAFLTEFAHWRVMLDVFMIALCGGLFVVPLNAIIQKYTKDENRARILAGSAIINACFIAVSSAISAFLILTGWEIREIFLALAIANAFVAIYICALLPDYLLKSFMQALFKLLYNVEVRGQENIEKAGPRAVIVVNHVSFLDAPILAAYLPGKPMFAVSSDVAEWWWVRPFLKLVDAFPLNPANPFSMKSLIKKVAEDKHVVIFPEGRLTETGALMKVYDGPGMVADKTDAYVLPVRLDGVQHTPFARLKGKVPKHNFPKITMTILEPRKFKIDEELKGRKRRAAAGRQLYDLMEDMMFITGDRKQTLFEALLKAKHVNGGDAVIAEDQDRKPMKFNKLLQGCYVLGNVFKSMTERAENVGVMLPNSNGALMTFFALQMIGRVPAMLNFSAGEHAIASALKTAKVKTVLTSRRFIEQGRLQNLEEEMRKHAEVIYLEDIRKNLKITDKIGALFARFRIESEHRSHAVRHGDPAVVLFTSGSEGLPKGVVLSHENIMTNVVQLTARVDFNRQDIVFNCLPMFHSFGLTGGTLLPVLSGVKTFLYPSPLHYRIVPELVYYSNATIMFGTDTFLTGYAKMADPYDFYRMRYIFAGAEKVREETRKTYMERYGVRILEGYGVTETAPVIAVNSPMQQKPGTVGRFLPGLEHAIEKMEGVDEGGRLYLRGPNVMLGYLLADNPGVLQPPEEGWHDTGDIVAVDAEGFVAIKGRAKRFAKIAGEMVSLATSEAMAQAVWPDAEHAVVNMPDERKGEKLILVTTKEDPNRDALSAYAKDNGITPLAVPAQAITVDQIPVLGTGKADYPGIKALVEEQLKQAA